MKNLKTMTNYSDFTNYVYSFYGQGGAYERFFEQSPVTKNEIEMLFSISLKKDQDFWFNEDTICREVMRDLLFYHRGMNFPNDGGLEHQWYLDKWIVNGLYI
jgi:hypothetical protein